MFEINGPPGRDGGVRLRPYQTEAIDRVRDRIRSGVRRVVLVLSTGGGKCLARGTPVLMFDGSIKTVEQVEIGDLLMGPDSRARTVLSLAH
ncbi:MAG: hypothetical protein HY901_34795, partial [Deltaproteobacteria bacterium]|nr:hypothetical protein [Deltaproteobacteria bacterium]